MTTEEKNVSIVSPSEIESMQMPTSGALVKLESIEMTVLARQVPRNHKAVLADVVAQLEAYPSFAKAAIYNKPIGKDEKGQMKYARGLSIRAAEALFSSWGNCAASFVPTDDSPDYAEFAAIFVDYERCTKFTFPVRVSKSYKSKRGEIIKHPPDRFVDVIMAAARSRALREVITRSIPPGLREELFEKAEEIIDGLLDEKTQEKIISSFATIGITKEQIEAHIGKKVDAFTKADRGNLLGTFNAIKDGETTIREAFSIGDPDTATPIAMPKLMEHKEPPTQTKEAPKLEEEDEILQLKEDSRPPSADGFENMRTLLMKAVNEAKNGKSLTEILSRALEMKADLGKAWWMDFETAIADKESELKTTRKSGIR